MTDERDDFWDVSKLVPKKKTVMKPFATQITPADHTVGGDVEADNTENKLTFTDMKSSTSEEHTYYPCSGSLVKRVTIRRFEDKYDFYGSFRKAALVYYDYKTDKCEFVPYYSYMPQYSQLTSSQKNYYFYWRDSVRRGKFIKSDYSYLYLYVYEILNLPDKIPPEEGILLLCKLWREYRSALSRIDAYFSLWIQDYCLVYNIPCPMEHIKDFIFDVIGATLFKEFYLSDASAVDECGVDSMLAYLSDYDWRRGKYAGGDSREIYEKYMHLSMKRLFFHLKEDGLMSGDGGTAIIKRDAFARSLCTHAVKCRLEIEYIPLSRNENLRRIVTAGVRYTENKLRALLGIKSRLAVKDFPDEYKRTVDRFFDALISEERTRLAKNNIPEYEKLYDAPKESLSLSGADEIERASWSTTARLVVEDEIDFAEPIAEEKEPEIFTAAPAHSDVCDFGLSPTDINVIRDVLKDTAILTDDSVAERINNAFVDGMGDIILEFDGDKYSVIEDYREEVEEWLTKQLT